MFMRTLDFPQGEGIDKSTHNEKVMRAVKMVELENFLHRKPAELSGGQGRE